jgi:excisionase family DNA binding protein
MSEPMTTKDVARVTKRTPATVQRWCRHGLIPHKRLQGQSLLFDRAEIDAWLASKSNRATEGEQ